VAKRELDANRPNPLTTPMRLPLFPLSPLTIAAMLLPSPCPAAPASQPITPLNASILYDVSCFQIFSCHGEFAQFTGAITPNSASDFQVNVTVSSASITNVMVAAAPILRSTLYFDAAHYPVITFIAPHVRTAPTGSFPVRGVLIIRGISKSLEFIAHQLPNTQIEAQASINRADFGMHAAPLMIGQTVRVTLRLTQSEPQS